MEFIHPVRKEPVVITAIPPDEPLWNVFLQMVGEEEEKQRK
jgi:hypothetical protein